MKEIKTTLEFEGKNYDVITKEFPSCGLATRIFVCGETDVEKWLKCIHIDPKDIQSEHFCVCAEIGDYLHDYEADVSEDDEEVETDEETVSITRKELIAKMAKVFADWAKERKTDSALIVSVVVGADIANRLCDSIFGKKGE